MKRFLCLLLALLLCVLLCGCAAKGVSRYGLTLENANVRPLEGGKRRVYYEIFVGSFYDADANGVGDLKGVEQKLDYLNDGDMLSTSSLHVNGLWLMPVMPSPSYHKYDVTDYYAVAPEYGSMDDFEALVSSCGERGVSVLLDLVLNHSSSEHPWFLSACKSVGKEPCGQAVCAEEGLCRAHNKYCGYYMFSKEAKAGYHPVPGADGWYYEGRFWSGMPDFDLDDKALFEEFKSIMAFWLEKGVSGFRLDAVTSFYTGNNAKSIGFLKKINEAARAIKSDVYIVGEAWSNAATVADYYESGIDSFFNFPFSQAEGAIVSAVKQGGGARLAKELEAWQTRIFEKHPDAIDAPFLSNHDNARSAGALLRNKTLQKQAAAVYLLLPGNPFIYYGEEIGMTGGAGADENKRLPLIWSLNERAGIAEIPAGATKTEPVEAGVFEQLNDESSLLRFYNNVLLVRAAYPALSYGRVTALEAGHEAVCLYRADGAGQALLVAHNLGSEGVSIPLPFALKAGAFLSADGQKMPVLSGSDLELPAYSSAVLEITDKES